MAVIDRHRVARLIELSAAERTLKGPERLLREDDVAQLVRAAFDDAAEKARVDFMARVSRAPSSGWPWSAVQVSSARGGGGLIGTPKPLLDLPPPAVLLLMGQVDSPEVDPTHRVPDRTSPEGAAWEPLFKALETWDTVTLKKWMHASGWAQPGTGAPKTDLPASPTSPPPASPPTSSGPPAPSAPPDLLAEPTPWTTERVAFVAGAAVVVTGAVVYSAVSLARARDTERLSARLRAQEENGS